MNSIVRITRGRFWLAILFVAASAVAAVLTMATALSVADFLQLIFPDGSTAGLGGDMGNPITRVLSHVYVWLASMETTRALGLYALLLVGLYGVKNVFSYCAAVVFAHIKVGVLREIRNGLHRAALCQDMRSWGAQQQGQWLSKMGNDVAEYEANVLDSIQLIVSAALTIGIYVAMLFFLDWSMTLTVVGVMAVGTLLLTASRRLKRKSRELQGLNGELMSLQQETLDGLKEIKAAAAIDYVNERQKERNALFTRRRIGIYRRIYAASPISDFVGNCVVAVILMIGALRVTGADSTMGAAVFVSYIMIYVLTLTPVKDFSNGIALLKKGKGVEERITNLDSPLTFGHCSPEKTANGDIELSDVSFGYGEHRVLSHVSFIFCNGSMTAVVGESGCGKTTVGRIIAGLLEPQEGDIMFDGRVYRCEERRGLVAYVPQEPMLFNDSIEENIRFGREWIGEDDVRQAVEQAQLGEFVANLNNGIKTEIGDGGGRLSGGERMRVSIARALAGGEQIVVMDEATAALDAATEMRLTKALKEGMKGKTVVVIAHRPATIAQCDHIMRLGC